MNRMLAFLVFMLFLAGLALIKLKDMVPLAQDEGVPNRPLVGTEWWAEVDHEGAVSTPSLQLEMNGNLSGSGGCNRISGQFVATDETIQIQNVAATRRACADSVMELEQTFVENLQSVTRYRIRGNRLTLAGEDTATLLFIAATDDSETAAEQN